MSKDTIYSEQLVQVPRFEFDRQVASVFDDMIPRSVPLYHEVQELCAAIAKTAYQEKSTIYDLGCSTGTTLIGICNAFGDRRVNCVAVDAAEPMLRACRDKLAKTNFEDYVQVVNADIENVIPANSSLVLLNYTLQFIAPECRHRILRNIYRGMLPGGVLVLSEKVHHQSQELESMIVNLHHDFKRENGYSDLEISQKREAISEVLVPLSLSHNQELLQSAGFKKTEVVLKYYNFATIVAVKEAP